MKNEDAMRRQGQKKGRRKVTMDQGPHTVQVRTSKDPTEGEIHMFTVCTLLDALSLSPDDPTTISLFLFNLI